METSKNFTEGPILSKLLHFAVPILLALFLQAMYGAVDLMVVGQFGDASDVSAVATGSQIMQTLTGIITGLTMGTTILIGQKIGERDEKGASRAVGTSICLFMTIAVVLTVIMLFAAPAFSRLMHAPQEAFEKTVQYVLICSAGTIFIVAYNVISGLFRGMGNSKLPLIFVAIACVTNIVGDLLFVAGFHWDTAGAAAATVLAQAVSVILSLVIIKQQKLPFPFSRQDIRFSQFEIQRILKLGAPIALQDALTNVSFLLITAIMNGMGLVISAAVGVSEKLIVFIMLVPLAYMSAISAFCAQNIGAGKPERAKKALKYGIVSSLAVGMVLFLGAFFKGNIFASIFARDEAIIAACAEYMKSYAIDCMMVSILFCFMGYFNGRGKTAFVMLQGAMAAFLVRIPYCYFMSKSVNVTMFKMGLASPLATLLSICVCLAYFTYSERSHETNSLSGCSAENAAE